MDAGVDTQTGPDSTDMADRLRGRAPGTMRSFLGSWSGAVYRYCHTVCEPNLVAQAVEVAFADFLEKVDSHPIRDSHLEPALMRSTRLTAAEAARIDWDEPGPPESDRRFGCELTPLLMAGSPSARASVELLARMDDHVLACPRCQASARRFVAAEEVFSRSEEAGVPPKLVKTLLEKLSATEDEAFDQGEEIDPEAGLTVESQPDPRWDTTIGGFQIVAVHGEDADGVTFCTAVDEDDEHVTLRLVPPDTDPDFRARFLRDARLLAGLAHPSLPSVLAVGEAPDGAYVVTEELQSRSLASVVEEGLPTKQVIRLLGQAAHALDTAHAAGLLHRQLRPANVVVGAWLVVRPLIADFALGRSPDVVRGGDQTPYLAPEELLGKSIGPAADLYALGCTLFELLTGWPPFGTSKDAIHGHLNEAQPLATEARPDLPPALDGVFERALAKLPEERFASAAELTSEVARAMLGPPVATPPDPLVRDIFNDQQERDVLPPRGELEPGAQPEAEPPEPSDSDEGAEAGAPDAAMVADRPVNLDATLGPGEDLATRDMEAVAVGAHTGAASAAGHSPDTAERRPNVTPKRAKLIAAAGAAAAGAAIVVVALVGGGSPDGDRESRPERSPPTTADKVERRAPVRSSQPVALAGTKAVDYDPNGGNGEQPATVGALTDGDVRTEWQTEFYPSGAFGRGVGAYVTLPRAHSLKAIEIRTTTPGWDAEVYGAATGPPSVLPARGWSKLGSRSRMRRVERVQLVGDSRPVRYCLVWITKLPAGGAVSIAEIRLLG